VCSWETVAKSALGWDYAVVLILAHVARGEVGAIPVHSRPDEVLVIQFNPIRMIVGETDAI
jgi:hypothetical protein